MTTSKTNIRLAKLNMWLLPFCAGFSVYGILEMPSLLTIANTVVLVILSIALHVAQPWNEE